MLAACDIWDTYQYNNCITACKYLLGDFIVKINLNMQSEIAIHVAIDIFIASKLVKKYILLLQQTDN